MADFAVYVFTFLILVILSSFLSLFHVLIYIKCT
jgi:hypothetical protein